MKVNSVKKAEALLWKIKSLLNYHHKPGNGRNIQNDYRYLLKMFINLYSNLNKYSKFINVLNGKSIEAGLTQTKIVNVIPI